MAKHWIRCGIAALALGGALSIVAAAGAQHRPLHPRPRPVAAFSLRLEDEGGGSLPSFRHAGQSWVMGEVGERYVIIAENPTSERVEVVVSVDGRDVLSGRPANFRRHRGYVVPPFGSARIEGFRQSLDAVASFRFSDRHASYSARMGTPENVGIIGAAFFRERSEPAIPLEEDFPRRIDPPRRRMIPAPPHAGGGGALRFDRRSEPESSIGTEFGESRLSPVRQVPFERASNTPARIVTLRYDDAAGLEARGIDVSERRFTPPRRRFSSLPEAFPGSRFSPPPP